MANQTALKNNCRASQPAVFPKNWQTGGTELLAIKWYITYRFYDDNLGQDKKVMIRDFNNVHTLKERRASVYDELSSLHQALADGFNPFNRKKEDKKIVIPAPKKVSEKIPFIDAMIYVFKQKTIARGGKEDDPISMLKCADPSHRFYMPILIQRAKDIHINDVPICDIGRGDVKQLLDKCGIRNDGEFSGDQFNRYRTMLHSFYEELIEYEICEANIPHAIKKKKPGIKRMRPSLDDEQREAVDKHLRQNYIPFWLYLNCFYHSGARGTEMFRLRIGDIDFKKQRIKYQVEKGAQYEEVYRTMPNIAVKYWQAVVWGAPDDFFVFGKGLIPRPVSIRAFQITKRWYRLVKKAKDEKGDLRFPDVADFYGIKKNKVSDLGDEVGPEIASSQFAENPNTLRKHYDTNSKTRNHDVLTQAGKEFA